MKKLLLIAALILIPSVSFASDYHQRDQQHAVIYQIVDSSGKPVSGQTVSLQLIRVSDDTAYDFSSGTFKSSGWTTRYATMRYDNGGEYYYYTITPDAGRIQSGEYVCVISNDNATYSDHKAEAVEFDSLGDLVKYNR